ncbi:hypothetical protein MMPV_000278 [Pyropia vietnamensis]
MALPQTITSGVPPTPTVIVGGGPVGLTVALHLVARGWKEVMVVERAAVLIEGDKNRTYAMGINHKGQEVLEGVMAAATRYRRIGGGVTNGDIDGGDSDSISEGDTNDDLSVAAGAAKLDAFDVAPALRRRAREAPDGLRVWTYNPWGRGAPSVRKRSPLPGRRPSWIVRRRRLQEVLIAAAEAAGVTIRMASAVTGISFGQEDLDSFIGATQPPLPIAVHLKPLAGKDGEEETVRAGLLLGCDGCSSIVREALALLPSVAEKNAVPDAFMGKENAGKDVGKASTRPRGDTRRAFSTACRPPPGGPAATAAELLPPAACLVTGGMRVETPAGFGATHYPYSTQGWRFKAIPMPIGHPVLGHPVPEGAPYPLPAVMPLPSSPPPDVVSIVGAGRRGAIVRPRARQFSLVAFRTGDDDAGVTPLSLVLAPPGHDLWSVKSGSELRALFAENFPSIPGGGASLLLDEATAAEVAAAPAGTLPRMVVPHSLVAAVTPVADGGAPGASYAEDGHSVRRSAVGGVALLGDAAHPVPPDLGLGVNTGLADVEAFVAALDCPAPPGGGAAVGGDGDGSSRPSTAALPPLHAALATYAADRSAEAAALCGLSARFNGFGYNNAAPFDGYIGYALGLMRIAAVSARANLHLAIFQLSRGLIPPPVFVSLVRGDSYASVLANTQKYDRRLRWAGLAAGGLLAVLLGWRLLA